MLAHLGKDGRPVGGWPVGSNDWSGSRDNNWGRSIGPDWSRSVSWGRGIDGLSRVLDVSDVASVGIGSVGHSLETTIGKSNVVLSLSGITVAGLGGSKVGTAVSVIDSIGVVVCWGDNRVDRGRSISRDWDGSWPISRRRDGVLRSSSSGSHQSKESNEALKVCETLFKKWARRQCSFLFF